MKAATISEDFKRVIKVFQSTPPVKAATPDNAFKRQAVFISIHAAREGGDLRVRRFRRPQLQFQSTPPVKAATITQLPRIYRSKFQSTPPVKAATDTVGIAKLRSAVFQSTPPVKAATRSRQRLARFNRFQSTPPVKAATLHMQPRCQTAQISIHAAREGGDKSSDASSARRAISIHAAREGGDFAKFPPSAGA